MPAVDGTLTPEDVAAELGVPVDDRVTACTDAARARVQRRRSLTEPAALWREADAHRGGVLFGALLYQTRTTPQGMAGFDPESASATSAEAYWRAMDLIGEDLVIS